MGEFKRQSLAEKLARFEREVNEVEDVQRKLKVETISHVNSGEVILAQLFHYIERTMAKVMDVFEQIDTDDSGCIDRGEFRRAVDMMGFEVPGMVPGTLRKPEPFEVDAAFDVLDADKGGEVEIEEFLAAMKTQRKQAALEALERQQRGEECIGDDSTRKAHELEDEQRNDIRRTITLSSGNGGLWRPTEKTVRALEKWLWHAELFSFMSPEQRRKFCTACDVQCVLTDNAVLRKGDASGGLFILFEGKCAIYLPRSQNISNLDAKAGLRKDVTAPKQAGNAGHRIAAVVEKAVLEKQPNQTERESEISEAAEAVARKWRGRLSRRGADGTSQLVELTFGPAEIFGEERAFHNIKSDLVREQGLMTVSATVVALQPCQFIVIKQPELLVELEQAYQRLQEYKISFLKRIPHYKFCSESSLKLLARNLRRVICAPRQVMATEGELADRAFFIMSGKMQVEQGGNPVAVLGPESCFGDWGVINGETRAASLSCVTECEVLVIHAYNFVRTVDKRIISALKEKQMLVQAGKSFASATQIVEDQVRKTIASQNFEIIRKSRAPSAYRGKVIKTTPEAVMTRSSDFGAGSPASPHASAISNRHNKSRESVEKPSVSLNLELDERLAPPINSGKSHCDTSPLRLVNGAITAQQQTSTERSSSSPAGTSIGSDPVSASSDPDRPPRTGQVKSHSSPRAPDDSKAIYLAAPDRSSRSSRSSRLFGVEPHGGNMFTPPSPRAWTARGATRYLGPRQRHHTERERASPRGRKLPSLQFKVASPRNLARQQQQQQQHQQHLGLEYPFAPANSSPRCTTADAAATFGFLRQADQAGRASRRSPLRSATTTGQCATGGLVAHSMLAREKGRIQSQRGRAIGLEIDC